MPWKEAEADHPIPAPPAPAVGWWLVGRAGRMRETGGGSTGGAECTAAIRRDFKQLQVELCRVVLVDAVGSVCLQTMHPTSRRGSEYLERNGVELCLAHGGGDRAGQGPAQGEGEPRFSRGRPPSAGPAGVRASRLEKIAGRAQRLRCGSPRGACGGADFSVAGHPELGWWRALQLRPPPATARACGWPPGGEMGRGLAGRHPERQIKVEVSPPFRWWIWVHGGDRSAVRGGRPAGLRVTGLLRWAALGTGPPAFHPARKTASP